MEKRNRTRLAKRRAAMKAEYDAVPHIPSNLVALVNKLKSIADFYQRSGDDVNLNEINALILRINSKLLRVNDIAFTFRHFSLAGNAQYVSQVNQLIALSGKAEELPYPITMMLEAAKERLKQRILECNAEGILPDTDETYIRLKERIKTLEHEAGR